MACRKCKFFLFGVGIGTVAGILLAPKSGREIRRELFGGQLDVITEPGTETEAPMNEEIGTEEDLKAKIEETRTRLKAEVESQQED
ncbi:MAG: YtxH domain-containing protein [Thermoleophilia bacterium]